MTEMMKKLQKTGIVPVVVLENADDALPLAERLMAGGLPCAEVTFRTAAAEESIRRMAKAFPEMIIGGLDRKSTRLNSSHRLTSRMPYH